MKIFGTLAVGIMTIVAGCTPARERASGPDLVLYSKPLPSGAKIEVVRGANLPLDECRAEIGSATLFAGFPGIYPVRIQVRKPMREPIVLVSRVRSGPWPDGEVEDVLDLAVDGDRIALAVAADGFISIWYFNFVMGDYAHSELSASEWDGASGVIPINHNTVDAKFGRTSNGERLTVTITERNRPEHRKTIYEETGPDGWPRALTFKMTSQTPPFEEWVPPTVQQ